jgi:hypothetical protein
MSKRGASAQLISLPKGGGALHGIGEKFAPEEGWNNTRCVERRALEEFPDINFSDPRVRWADMSGDGLQDIVLIYDANVEYWPNLG